MAREKPLHEQMVKFCKYHLGKDCFAPLTGGDWPAWTAFVYLLQCYAHGGSENAFSAMRATLRCAQRTEPVLRVFVQAIPGVMDWGDVARLWPRLVEPIERDVDGQDLRTLYAVERCEVYRGNSKTTEERVWRHGLGQDARSIQAQKGATP